MNKISLNSFADELEKIAGVFSKVAPYIIGAGAGIGGTLAAQKLLLKEKPPFCPGMGQGMGRGRGMSGGIGYRTNAPTFAYKAVYGKEPTTFLRGRTDSPKKMWKGIEVDKNLKTEWLEGINNNKHIEVRGTDEGKSSERVPFVSFRLQDVSKDAKAGKVVAELNKIPGVYSTHEKGAEGRNRIVVAGNTHIGKKDWSSWWDKLPNRLQTVTNKVLIK